jgi:hypothetical protein
MQYYTYLHKRNDTNEIFYVGKGSFPQRMVRKDNRNRWWHNIVNVHGFSAEVIAHWATEKEAHDHEKFLIWCFKDMGTKLVNATNGGEGISGHVMTAESRAKMSARKKGIYKPWNVGKAQSEETKLKISLANKGKPGPKGPQPKFVCPHCQQTVGGLGNLNRWHLNNCKEMI